MPYKDRLKRNEATHRWYVKNKEKKSLYDKKRREENKEEIAEYKKNYKGTPIGRAASLLSQYNFNDKKYNRGKGDLTAKWIVENIFSKPCAHCGKIGWQIIGCNRIDNSKPHTMDNVEPCCFECNSIEYGKETSRKVYQINTKDDTIIKCYNSITDCAKDGFGIGHIWECCIGRRKTHKGYKWSYEPL